MRSIKILIIYFVLCFAAINMASAQEPIMRSNITEHIDGKDFYLHEVKKGQTFYSIARAYHVNLDDLKYYNPGLTDELEIGRIIKIPAFKPGDESASTNNENAGYIMHKVRPKATLYGLSKEFDVSIEEIKTANDGLPNGLKEGTFIKIPKGRISNPGPEFTAIEQEKQAAQKDYFEYQARDRETVYYLAIKYRVSIDSIYHLNPGIGEQLKNEQIIKIPYPAGDEGFIAHKVRKRQTVNRLARKYNIDVEAIKIINPYISRHLIEGQSIKIPLPELQIAVGVESGINDSLYNAARHDTLLSQKEICANLWQPGKYKIALMLPFFLSGLDGLEVPGNAENGLEDAPEFIKSFTFIQFYEGFMMAVDSLKKLGLNVEVYVYSVDDDINKTKQLTRNPELKQMDLIVGPVYSSSFTIMANFARQHNIHIVNPFTGRSEIIVDNPYVFKLTPSLGQQFNTLVKYLNRSHSRSQIFIAKHNPYRDEIDFNLLRSALDKDLDSRHAPFTDLYHEIVYSRDSVYTFLHKASVDHENVVITFSDDKVFILEFMRELNELRDTFPITVIGIPEWKKIDFLELEYLDNLKTQILSDTYVDYNSPWVRQFIRSYRRIYQTEPQDYAFRGYDIAWYFLSALMKYGTKFEDCINYYDKDLLQLTLDFEKTPTGGFENQFWYMLRIRDYKFNNISVRLEDMEFRRQ